MDINKMLDCLPKEIPFLMLDKIIDIEPGKRITALKNISFGDGVFNGKRGVGVSLPGSMALEAMAQAGYICLYEYENNKIKHIYVDGFDKSRFRRPVKPGDSAEIIVEFEKVRLSSATAKAWIYVNGHVASETNIVYSIAESYLLEG